MNTRVSWFPRAGLRARLLVLVSLALVPVLVLIIWMNVRERREKTAMAYEEVARVVRLAVSEQSRQIDATRHLLVDLSRHPEIWTPTVGACAARLRDVYYELPAYTNLGVALPNGEVPCTVVEQQDPINFADREWFRRAVATQQLVVAGVSRGRISGLPVIVVALPLVDEAGVRAVVYASIGLGWLRQFAGEARLGDDATFAVVDGQNTVFARDSGPDRWGPHDVLGEPLVRDIATTRRGTMERRGLDGVKRLYAFAPLVAFGGISDIYLAIGVPSARAFASANHALVLNLSMLALAAALTVAVAWSGGTALILNAVRRLLAATRRLGDGDLTARVGLSGNHGELTQLAQAFDEMAGALEQREAELAAAEAVRRAVDRRLQWATIAETSSDAIIGIDTDDVVFSWNAGAETLFGHASAEAIGAPIVQLVTDDRVAGVEDALARVRRGERVNDLEIVAIRKDGGLAQVSCTFSLIYDLDFGVSMIARDITERRRADARRRVQAAALEAAANGIVITDADGTIEWVNPAFTVMTGYGHDEVVGATPRVLKSGRHDPAFYEALWATVRAGKVWRGELVNRRKDGTLYDEEQTITPVLDGQGAVTHFVAVKQDVTARRQAREALRRSEEHFRSLIEHALDMIFVVDAAGILRYASPSVERATGYRPEEMVGKSVFALLHPDDVGAVRATFVEALGTPGFTASVEYRVAHKDGTWRAIEAVGRNLVEDPGVVGIVINARDVTERKRAEDVQRQLQRQLAQTEKLAAMGDLLAGVAHELNNPLSIVIGHASLLEAAAGTDTAVRAGKIEEAAQRCARIVRNFLTLARQHAPERTEVDLRRLVRDTCEMMAYPLRVDTIEVALDLSEEVPLVPADSHGIQQVLVNLITNAHHALRTAPGPRRLTIGLHTDRPARYARLTVSDTGAGMSPDTRRRLFEPFFTTKPIGQGTGLGLSICKGIVESHGGQIEVDAAPGRGTTFTVTLPLDAPLTTSTTTTGAAGPARPCRVLVVDDEPEVVAVLTELLTADGHTVDGARSGEEALMKIGAGAYDVILSDVRMPGLDGPGLYRAVVRERPELSARFVFFTGDTLDAATSHFLEQTGAPSFSKPFGLEVIRASLARVPLEGGV